MAPLTVEAVPTSAVGLDREWLSLQEKGAVRTPFLTWEWFSAFAESPELSRGAEVLRVQDAEGTTVGIFPVQTRTRAGRVRTLRCAGTEVLAADHLDVVALDEDRPAVAAAVARHVAGSKRWDVADLDGLDGTGALASALPTALRSARTIVVLRPTSEPVPVIDFKGAEGESVRQLLAKRSSRGLKSVRRAGGGYAVLADPEGVAAGLRTLMRMHNERFGERSTVFATEELRDFHIRASTRMASAGLARVCRLYTAEADIALEYVLLLDDRAFGYQSGFRPEAAHAPGRTVMCQSILTAMDEGRRLYDFLRGDEPYKLEYATSHHNDVRIRAVRLSAATAAWAAGTVVRRIVGVRPWGAGSRD